MQINHLLDLGAEINQRDDKGFTPLHRAAYLAHYEGYLEIYEYLLVDHISCTISCLLNCSSGLKTAGCIRRDWTKTTIFYTFHCVHTECVTWHEFSLRH